MMIILSHWCDQCFPSAFSAQLLQNILLQIDILQIAWFHADREDDNEENQRNGDDYYCYEHDDVYI